MTASQDNTMTYLSISCQHLPTITMDFLVAEWLTTLPLMGDNNM
ncbi:hypothetical protein [Lactococcus lactis]|nr:hypothetical protein [Lactococcus lactis]